MGIICKIIDDKKRKEKKTKTEERETVSNKQIEYGTPEELQGIIDGLLTRKKNLENICGELNFQNDDNVKPKSIEEYQFMINKVTKEVEELEQIYNLWENKNIEIQFFYEQQVYKTNVNRETKLGDAFKNALLNNEKLKGVRYTNNMDRETGFTDENFRNTQQFNYEQMQFSFGGDNITEYFRKNKPVPSLFKDPNSIISIYVHSHLSTKIMGNIYYNQ